MLAGLLIATHDAEDRSGMLTATLPFGGVTLIEYQARLLIAAGASQLVIMVARLTPELLGAINRIGKRNVAVDTVRSAAEAAEKLHPLARIVMLADGLTTTAEVVAGLAREGGDALLVIGENDGGQTYERVGGGMAWAGVARLASQRIAELAALPRDYDLQSTLVRLASQARAVHVLLPPEALKQGHGIDHRGATLAVRGRSVLTAAVSTRRGWFDRLVIVPLARLIVPMLVPRNVPVVAVASGAGALAMIGLATIWGGHAAIGSIVALVATIALAIAGMLAGLRDDRAQERTAGLAATVLQALAVLLVGRGETVANGSGTPAMLAVFLVLLAALTERASKTDAPRWWWGSPTVYLLVVAIGSVLAVPTLGLGVAALYATVTLAAAIERLREQA